MKKFLTDITSRNGAVSSKKFWYNVAGATGTGVVVWLAYKLPTPDGMDDMTYVWLFGIYLLTVGGFDVILETMRLLVQFKSGGQNAVRVDVLETDRLRNSSGDFDCPALQVRDIQSESDRTATNSFNRERQGN